MNENSQGPSNLKGALFGGLLMAIPTVIPLVSCCCFVWGGAGGALAAYMGARTTDEYGAGPGAFAGLYAAGVGTLIYAVLSTIMSFVLAAVMGEIPQTELPPEIPPELAEIIQAAQQPGSPIAILLGVVFMGVVFCSTGALGGLIAGSLIGKKQD